SPRASTAWVISRTGMAVYFLGTGSDEQDLALAGSEVEGGHPLDAVDERVEIDLLEMQEVHRQGAGLDVDAAELLRLAERVGPGRLTGGSKCVDRRPTRCAGLRGEPMVAGDAVGTEGFERPVLEEDVDRLAERSRARGQDRGGLELVVRAGEQDQVQRLIHGDHLVLDPAWARSDPGRSVAIAQTPAVMDSPARRRMRRSRTSRMIAQATITSGSVSR